MASILLSLLCSISDLFVYIANILNFYDPVKYLVIYLPGLAGAVRCCLGHVGLSAFSVDPGALDGLYCEGLLGMRAIDDSLWSTVGILSLLVYIDLGPGLPLECSWEPSGQSLEQKGPWEALESCPGSLYIVFSGKVAYMTYSGLYYTHI